MKTLVDICARIVYALYGAVVVGISAAGLSMIGGWLGGVVTGHDWVWSAMRGGLIIGAAVGGLIGLLGKMAVVKTVGNFWAAVPYMLLGALVVGFGCASFCGCVGLWASLVFNAGNLAGGMAAAGGMLGILLGCCIGYSQGESIGSFLNGSVDELVQAVSDLFESPPALFCILATCLLTVCVVLARYLLG